MAALLDIDLTVLCIAAVEEEDFFSMDLNEETVVFFWTVWMVFFLLT